MRNTIMVLLGGPLLFGCLASEEPNPSTRGSGAADNPAANSVPTISGNPSPAIQPGEMYNFVPSAADPNGDILNFTVQGKPDWASFDPATGRMYGQPTLSDIGVYNDIRISVSDGESTSSLSPFSITVSQSALGAVTLSWVAPTENSDGSALRDLAGYKIYCRKDSDAELRVIRIDNPGISTYVIEQLSPATYFFTATAFNASGVESSFSAEVKRTVE